MTKMRTYQCPGCSGQFDYLHHPNIDSDPAPRFCPLCGFDTQADEDSGLQAAVTMPALPRGVAKNVDGIFRAEQEGAAFRAELSGEPSLNVTDQRDNLRYGDIAAVPVVNPVSQFIDQNPNVAGWQRQQGFEHSQRAHAPDPVLGRPLFPNAGVRAVKGLRAFHSAQRHVTTDTPALETQQPGYRARV